MKRKLDLDSDDVVPACAKQLKLIPFPGYQPELDVDMSDVGLTGPHHTRIPSDASTCSSLSSYSPLYPALDIYPFPVDTDFPFDSPKPSPTQIVGLLQPSSDFSHHGTGCSQIPKLRLACSAGVNGRRTMWSHCEQCGAISMVDNID